MTKFPQRLRKMAFATDILDQEYLTDVSSLLQKSLRRGFLGKATTFESWNSFGRVGSLSRSSGSAPRSGDGLQRQRSLSQASQRTL
jgi:hypothetical protein